MIIRKHGQVIVEAGKPIRVEGWEVEREAFDPWDAPTEQLLLALAIEEAYDIFVKAMNSAAFQAIREQRAKIKQAADAMKNPAN